MTAATCGAVKRSGGACGRPAGWGTSHAGHGRCKLHLGAVGTHLVHAEHLRIADETAKVAAEYGFGPDVDVVTALQDTLNASHAVMRYWQERVRELEELTERGVGGSTDVAAAVRAEERARRDVARIAVDAGKLGIEAKRAAIDQKSAEAIVVALEHAVRELGADPHNPAVRQALAAGLRLVNDDPGLGLVER